MKEEEDDMLIAEEETATAEESMYEYGDEVGFRIKHAINAFNRVADGGGY